MMFKKQKKRAPGDKKIEDKLMEYGQNVKKKKAEQKIQKLKVYFPLNYRTKRPI